MAYENFAKTCISTKQWMTNIGQPEHIPMAQTCEIYCAAYINYSPLACKNVMLSKSNFYLDKLTRYAKHLLQWHRVLLHIALLREDECVACW